MTLKLGGAFSDVQDVPQALGVIACSIATTTIWISRNKACLFVCY
jgi:hypothetical protein